MEVEMSHWIFMTLEVLAFLALSAGLWLVFKRADAQSATRTATGPARAEGPARQQLPAPAPDHLSTEDLEIRGQLVR
jgi:hypothetical protein